MAKAAPVLVLANGVPGSGKSTLARSWVEQQDDPLALALDVDVLRGMLGGWRADLHRAGLAARAMALAAIGVHLAAGHDVIVPQYLRRPDFIDELERAAAAAGAAFLECAIVVPPGTAASRLELRTRSAAAPGPEGASERTAEEVHEDFAAFLLGRGDVVRISGEREQGPLDLDAAVRSVRQ